MEFKRGILTKILEKLVVKKLIWLHMTIQFHCKNNLRNFVFQILIQKL